MRRGVVDASRDGVDPVLDVAEVVVGEAVEVGALPDVAADEAVAFLVRGSLPGCVRVGEKHIDPPGSSELGAEAHLGSRAARLARPAGGVGGRRAGTGSGNAGRIAVGIVDLL